MGGILSSLPRRQRKALYTATTFERRLRMAVPLSRELRTRYGRRSLPVRKGDTVRVLSGSYRGREERVAKVDRRSYSLTLDNVTGKTADAKLKPLAIRPSHLVLTRLNLSDPWRRRVLRVPESETPPAEEAEATPEPTPEPAAKPTPAPAKRAPKAAAKSEEEGKK
ncbi:MAG: 50S ribosomal protein L24 [Thermoplasmata archaeon]|nr:50S ribosomal protein L24 [Thermoplasmata archaeon]